MLLPFDQFIFAELTAKDKEQRLQLNFATHQLLIHGQNLRRIEIAMQRMELSLIAKLSTNYQPIVVQGQPYIFKIVVKEMVPSKKQLSADTAE